MPNVVPPEVLRVRAALEKKLKKAREAVVKADVGLKAAIDVYWKAHGSGRLVPTARHQKLVRGITKAREKLTRMLSERQDVEQEHVDYYRQI